MLKNLIKKQEYIFEAWNRNLLYNPNVFVLHDSLKNSLTREETEDISGRVYAYLKNKKIGKEDVVFINLDRNIKIVLAIMGVLKNGSAFTVVESNHTKDRIDFIYKDCNAKIVINEENWDEIISCHSLNGYEITDDHDACFYVYTSGTTGTPKGVLHEYGELKLEMISETTIINSYSENYKTKFAMLSPFNFVAAMKVVVRFIYSGGKLFIIDNNTIKNPRKLITYLLLNRLNDTFFSPSHFKMFKGNISPFIKRIHIGAEPAYGIYKKGIKILNTYSMTESMFTVSSFTIDRKYAIVPIGKPMFDLPIKLVDENRNIVKENEIGEICFYNPFCRGYVNNEEENKKHFKDGWFYTGDLAIIQNGIYIYKGRTDDMIKINGNRIEPCEIEMTCKKVFGFKDCIAKGFEKEGVVALYYIGDEFIYDELNRKKLEALLPYYMLPSYFVRLDKFPLSTLGKVNKNELKLPTEIIRTKYVAPRNDFEIEFAKAVEKILSIDKIGINDDIFSLGLSSIGVMEVLGSLEKYKYLSPTIIYNGRNISEISRLYNEEKSKYLSIEEKENIGRKASPPIAKTEKFHYEYYNDTSLDLNGRIEFPFFIPKYLIVKRINKLIENDSTFNVVFEKFDDGLIHYVYNENTPYVKLEHMTKEELLSIDKTFLKPFELGKPFIRIRIIECKMKTYMYLQVSHIIFDGASFHNLLNNIVNALKGKRIIKTYFFAWVYDGIIGSNQAKMEDKNNIDFFTKHYFLEKYDNCCIKKDVTDGSGVSISKSISISLREVKNYCKKNNITINTFIVVASILAQTKYNGTYYNMLIWNYENRGPSDNVAGAMARGVFFKLNLKEVNNLKEVYAEFKKQSEEQIKRIHNGDYFSEYSSFNKEMMLDVTYLDDWFSMSKINSFMCKVSKLKSSVPFNKSSENITYLMCENDKKNMYFSVQYGLSNFKSESINKYLDILYNVIDSILDNSINIGNL